MRLPNLRDGIGHLKRAQHELESMADHSAAVFDKMTRTITARAESSSTCEPGNDSAACQKPVSASTQTLPIVLGVVIPISCALVVFLWLHRRNKKKQALEDLRDPHKSLDFGLDPSVPAPGANKRKRGKKGVPEMIITDAGMEADGNRTRGFSMDMLGSPYMLPAGLHGSRESLHSMTRSIRDQNDPYRPVAFSRSSTDTARSRQPFNENGSTYSGSTMRDPFSDRSNLGSAPDNTARNWFPTRNASLSRKVTNTSTHTASSRPPLPTNNTSELSSRNASLTSSTPTPLDRSEIDASLPPIPLTTYRNVEEAPKPNLPTELPAKGLPPPPPPAAEPVSFVPPPRTDSSRGGGGLQITVDDRPYHDSNEYGARPPPPALGHFVEEPEQMEYDVDPDMLHRGRFSIDNSAPSQNNRLSVMGLQNNRVSVMGLRPLPPDHPEENAEQRANRIRSFYKEYFDVNKANPANNTAPNNVYYEDYDADYADYNNYCDGWYDPDSGGYYQPQMEAPPAPWAQPMPRRAMTPPPRGVPRFEGGHDRNYSTMSGGRGPFRGRPPPKKQLPPPKALSSLPTPHLLKDDAALFNASDFAPPTSFRELQNGRRPDSPMGTQRPFSPGVKAFSPLVSSFQSLSPIPSPHELRKSGTFTSLDFGPAPPRFRGTEGVGSDAGSIRSARSGMSAMQMDAVRSGAYRVSRIPKQYVTSREDLTTQLRPKMNLTTPA